MSARLLMFFRSFSGLLRFYDFIQMYSATLLHATNSSTYLLRARYNGLKLYIWGIGLKFKKLLRAFYALSSKLFSRFWLKYNSVRVSPDLFAVSGWLRLAHHLKITASVSQLVSRKSGRRLRMHDCDRALRRRFLGDINKLVPIKREKKAYLNSGLSVLLTKVYANYLSISEISKNRDVRGFRSYLSFLITIRNAARRVF